VGSVAKSGSIRKRDEEGREIEKLDGDIKQAIDQCDLGENITFIDSVDLPFSDHVHRFVTRKSASCRVEGKET